MANIAPQVPAADIDHTPRPYLSVRYDEYHPETYSGVCVDFPGEGERIYSASGWPKDLADAEDDIHREGYHGYLHASSLDNFKSDLRVQQENNG